MDDDDPSEDLVEQRRVWIWVVKSRFLEACLRKPLMLGIAGRITNMRRCTAHLRDLTLLRGTTSAVLLNKFGCIMKSTTGGRGTVSDGASTTFAGPSSLASSTEVGFLWK